MGEFDPYTRALSAQIQATTLNNHGLSAAFGILLTALFVAALIAGCISGVNSGRTAKGEEAGK